MIKTPGYSIVLSKDDDQWPLPWPLLLLLLLLPDPCFACSAVRLEEVLRCLEATEYSVLVPRVSVFIVFGCGIIPM
jgi:hypothetical protein